MRLEIVPFGEFSALGRLELLHDAPVPPRLLGGERVDRIDEAVAVVALDLRLGQLLAHRRHPIPQRRSPVPGSDCAGPRCRGTRFALLLWFPRTEGRRCTESRPPATPALRAR